MRKILISYLFLLFLMPISVLAVTQNNNPLLKEIRIEKADAEIQFDSMITEYVLAVPNEIENLEIEAVPQDKNATVEIIGETTLKSGNNVIEIQVTAEDKVSKQSYYLHITRGEVEKANANLKELTIEGFSLAPQFNKKEIEYVVEYTENLTELPIQATAENKKSEVQILGNNNLTEVVQKIEIQVTAEDKVTKKRYTIIAKKAGQEVEDPAGVDPVNQKQEPQKYDFKIVWIIGIGAVASAVIVYIRLIRNKTVKNNDGGKK